jgi:hypothetical protein
MACQNCACGPRDHVHKVVNVAEYPDEETVEADCIEDEEDMRHAAMKVAGAQLLEGRGLRVAGWRIQANKQAILKMDARDR